MARMMRTTVCKVPNGWKSAGIANSIRDEDELDEDRGKSCEDTFKDRIKHLGEER